MATETTPERTRGSFLQPTVVLAMLGGLGVVVAGCIALFGEVPKVLSVLMLVAGAGVLVLGMLALKHQRVAWAFLCSIYGTLSIGFLFGGPKIDEWFQHGMLVAYLPSVMCVVTTILLISCRDDF